MDTFLQVVAGVLIAVVLGLVVSKQSKEMAVLLSLLVCCMVVVVAVGFLEPVLDFWKQLQQVGQLDETWLTILMKVVGIGLIAEVASLVCADAGNGSLGKAIQILAAAVILWLSIPLLEGLLELVQRILGEA